MTTRVRAPAPGTDAVAADPVPAMQPTPGGHGRPRAAVGYPPVWPERRPRFDTNRIAGHKHKVIDLPARATRVSAETQGIVEQMRAGMRGLGGLGALFLPATGRGLIIGRIFVSPMDNPC